MSTPGAALALAALSAYQQQRKTRIAGVCVTGGGYKAAQFCDIVNQFYRPGERHGNMELAVGLAGIDALPADVPMTSVPVDRLNANGEPLYARTINRMADTSLAESQLRNAMTFNASNSVVLSAPATSLAATLRIANNRDILSEPVQRLILVESDELYSDRAAFDYLVDYWPTEIVMLAGSTGEEFSLPSASLDEAFSWAEDHPVVDAYRAYRDTPYEVPAQDLAAIVFAVETDASGFTLTEGSDFQQLIPNDATDLPERLIAAAAANPG